MGSKGEGGMRPRQSVEGERRKKSRDSFPTSEVDLVASSALGDRMFCKAKKKKKKKKKNCIRTNKELDINDKNHAPKELFAGTNLITSSVNSYTFLTQYTCNS